MRSDDLAEALSKIKITGNKNIAQQRLAVLDQEGGREASGVSGWMMEWFF